MEPFEEMRRKPPWQEGESGRNHELLVRMQNPEVAKFVANMVMSEQGHEKVVDGIVYRKSVDIGYFTPFVIQLDDVLRAKGIEHANIEAVQMSLAGEITFKILASAKTIPALRNVDTVLEVTDLDQSSPES